MYLCILSLGESITPEYEIHDWGKTLHPPPKKVKRALVTAVS